MSSDEITKVERQYSLSELERTKTKLVHSQDALALHELRNVLKRQQEQDLVIEELRSIIDTLSVGQVASINELQALRRTVDVLTRHQIELHRRQETIANVCDVYASRLETIHDSLVEEAKDKESP